MLFTRGELINNFVNVLKSTQIQNREAEPEPYSQLKEKIEEDNVGKMETARAKLSELLKAYSADQENKKKNMMVSAEVQATFE